MTSILIALALLIGSDKPDMPFIDAGACPFECCHYGSWTARQSVPARQTRNQRSPIAFTIVRGEKVTALMGVVVTYKPGVVRSYGAAVVLFDEIADPSACLVATDAVHSPRRRHGNDLPADQLLLRPISGIGKKEDAWRGKMSLRWVLNHMIEEYARHNGHADLLRERIDGAVGQ